MTPDCVVDEQYDPETEPTETHPAYSDWPAGTLSQGYIITLENQGFCTFLWPGPFGKGSWRLLYWRGCEEV